jgi:hypothetical protein
MLEQVDWERYGVVHGQPRDPRCENCMVHCGYDPSGALGTNYQRGDHWKNFKYNFWPRPRPDAGGLTVDAYNGCSVGKGHLAEAAAARKAPAPTQGEGGCRPDSAEREDLLAKVAPAQTFKVKAE